MLMLEYLDLKLVCGANQRFSLYASPEPDYDLTRQTKAQAVNLFADENYSQKHFVRYHIKGRLGLIS